MKKRIVGFVVCFALLLGFAHVALAAEGSALSIDTGYAIEGQTYGKGYVPTVGNNAARIHLPLTTGQAGLSPLRVTPVFDAGADSPFSYGNYEFNVSWDPDKEIFPVTLDLPLKADRKNGAYPVEFQCAYMDAAGTAYTQSFTVQVTISDGRDPNWAEPTPTPPPVAGQLTIDSHTLYPGMALTYAEGYVPTILNGRVYIVLPLLGQTYDNRVTVTADLGELQNSPFVYGNYSQTVTGYGKYVFGLEIPLLMERYSGTYPVELRADYLDVTGKQASQTFPVYVTITDGKTPPDPNEAPRQEVEKPELFISACKVEPETVGGEEEFSVAVTIDNIGAIRARSVRLTYGSEAAGIVPAETNNALHLDNIASEDSAEVTFRMKTTKDVLAGQQPFYITLDYADLYGGVYTNTRTFLIQVTQPAVMGYDHRRRGNGIPAGQRVQPGEKHPPKRDGDPHRGWAIPHQQRIPGGHPPGGSGLWGNEGIHWDAIHDGGLHGKLRPHHRRLYGHVPGRPGDRPRGGDPGLHRDQAAGDRGGKDRGTKASGGGSQARRQPMVDQRIGGLRGHCHNRGGDRGE